MSVRALKFAVSGLFPALLLTFASHRVAAEPTGTSAQVPADEGAPVEIRVNAEAAAPRHAASEVVRGRAQLAAAPHRTASDLMMVCPGVLLTQHSGEGKAHQIFYRGFDAEHGQDLEIWAGGAPVNDVSNIHGQGYADVHFLMPEVVKSIRCTPGSYDPRQGDFAVAGSLDLKLGFDRPGATAKVSAGSFGTRRYFVGYSPPGGSDETFAAAELYQTDGFGPSRAARRASGVAQGSFALSKQLSLRVLGTAYASRFDSAGVLRLDDIESGAVDRFSTYDPRQGGDSSRAQLVAELRDSSERQSFAITPYLVRHTLRLRQNFTGFLADPANGDGVQQLNDATTFGFRAKVRRPLELFSKRDHTELGFFGRADYVKQSQRRLSAVDDAVTREEVSARVRAADVGAYWDLAVQPLPQLGVRGGVRFDGLAYGSEDRGGKAAGQARGSQGTHVGAKATVEYRPLRWASALASYGDGFRSPQARSLGEGEKTPFTTVRSYEVGLRFDDGFGTTGSLAVFQTLLDADLAFDASSARIERVPGTRRTGFAAELTALPTPWFASSVSFTYTRAEFHESGQGYRAGELLPFVPACVLRSDSSLSRTLGDVWGRALDGRLGWSFTYLGRRPLPFAQMGHDVFLVDASAGLELRGVQLSLEAFNLLDARWYDGEFAYASSFGGRSASLVPLRHVSVGAPRSLLLSLQLTI
ncbi:MAG: TonB-dependent receptor [Myxococcales bacterium]|nr:MAG: TonB-dependent receptor [Myxococcales bacterium]